MPTLVGDVVPITRLRPITQEEIVRHQAEVSELRPKPRFEAFSLVFLAPKTIQPLQMLYRVEHDTLGTMELFLVPFEENEESFAFEALFNQKINAASD